MCAWHRTGCIKLPSINSLAVCFFFHSPDLTFSSGNPAHKEHSKTRTDTFFASVHHKWRILRHLFGIISWIAISCLSAVCFNTPWKARSFSCHAVKEEMKQQKKSLRKFGQTVITHMHVENFKLEVQKLTNTYRSKSSCRKTISKT